MADDQNIPFEKILEWTGAAHMREVIRAKMLEAQLSETRKELERVMVQLKNAEEKK